jgi:hypothetical protein
MVEAFSTSRSGFPELMYTSNFKMVRFMTFKTFQNPGKLQNGGVDKELTITASVVSGVDIAPTRASC